MASERQIAANRANAAKSTRPRSAAGKRAVSGFRHGLRSRAVLVKGESAAEFEELRARFLKEFQPRDERERELVEMLAVARWRQTRLLRAQASGTVREKAAAQYQARCDLQFRKVLSAILSRRY